MYIALLVIHVVVCLVLIAVILLQAGRGGGLTEAFSGDAQSVLGTQAPVVLKKATTISAIAFLVTSLLLGAITARRGRSLFTQGRIPVLPTAPVTESAPVVPVAPVEKPAGEAVQPAAAAPEAEAVTS